jgi:hypothetical protein
MTVQSYKARQYSYNLPNAKIVWISHKNHVNLQSGGLIKLKQSNIYLSKYWFTGDYRLIKVDKL